MQARGRIVMSLAMKLLEQAVALLGSASDEGQTVLKALTGLSKHFSAASGDLTRQEGKYLTEKTSPTASPQNPQAFQAMVRQRLQGMGMGGGATPSPPPPAMSGAA